MKTYVFLFFLSLRVCDFTFSVSHGLLRALYSSSFLNFKLAPHGLLHLFLYHKWPFPSLPFFFALCFPLTTPLDGGCVFVCSEAPEWHSGLPTPVWRAGLRSVGAACFTLHGGRCMKLTPPSHWRVHTSSWNNTYHYRVRCYFSSIALYTVRLRNVIFHLLEFKSLSMLLSKKWNCIDEATEFVWTFFPEWINTFPMPPPPHTLFTTLDSCLLWS